MFLTNWSDENVQKAIIGAWLGHPKIALVKSLISPWNLKAVENDDYKNRDRNKRKKI